MSEGYHDTRLAFDERRSLVWNALWHFYFKKSIAPHHTVLDLGAGYGDFINNVVAKRRIAIDQWPGLADHVAAGVEAVIAPISDLRAISDGSVDYAFASNLVEHLSQSMFADLLAELKKKLSSGGRLTLLQPNYRYAYREYFDDYTHVTVYSHITLMDFLRAHGWEILETHPRFLPLTVKSRAPAWRWLINAYLRSPIKPFGKQMLISAQPAR